MCGRYAMFGPVSVSREARAALERIDVDLESALDQREPLYNIAPTQKAPVLARVDEACSVTAMRWGLIPSWAKDAKIGSKLINARSETVAGKPSCRAAFRKRRCLIPASGYFEWKGKAGDKQPYFIHDPCDELLLFAGLWEHWKPAGDAEWLHTFVIVTGEPGKVSGDLHDRQPVILPPRSWEEWLMDETEIAADILRHAPAAELACHPVTRAVGSPRNQGAALVQPVAL